MSKIIDVDFKSKTIKNVTHQNKEINEANEDKINNDIPQNQQQTILPKSHQETLNQLYMKTLKHMQEVREAIRALGYDDQVSAQATVAMIEDCIDELWDNGVL